MSLCEKLKGEIEIKAPAEKFHEFYTFRPYLISKFCPQKSVDLLEGQWGENGSIICWNFFLDGKATRNKVVVEDVDNKTMSIAYRTIEGSFQEIYKSLKIIRDQVTPQEEGSLVHWTLEYEKLNESVPDPKKMLQVLFDSCKDIDAHLAQENT